MRFSERASSWWAGISAVMEDRGWNGWRVAQVAQVAHLQLLLHLHQLLLNNLLFSLLSVRQGIPRGDLARNV